MSKNTFQPMPMPDKDKLTATTSHGGFLVWLDAITLLIISFGTVADEFLNCLATPPKEPQADDRRPPRQTPVRPVAALTPNRLTFGVDPAPGGQRMDPTDLPSVCNKGAHSISNLPPFVYEHDEFGELTDPKGWDSFDTARTMYNTLLEAYTDKHNSLFAYIFTTFQPSALSVLQNQPTFRSVVQSKNVVQLRGLLNTVYTGTTAVQSLATLQTLITTKRQTGQTSAEFNNLLRTRTQNFAAAFQDPTKPGYVKIDAIHIAILLNCQPPQFAPFVDNLLMNEPLLFSQPVEVIEGKLRVHTQNQTALGRPTLPSNTKPALPQYPGTRPPKLSSHDTNNALATPAPYKANPWTPDFPHSAPRHTGKPTGDITRPHCPHCALNGYIRNNHGTPSNPCFDLNRLIAHRKTVTAPMSPTAPAAQTALLNQLLSALTVNSEQNCQADVLATTLASDDQYTFDYDALRRLTSDVGDALPHTA